MEPKHLARARRRPEHSVATARTSQHVLGARFLPEAPLLAGTGATLPCWDSKERASTPEPAVRPSGSLCARAPGAHPHARSPSAPWGPHLPCGGSPASPARLEPRGAVAAGPPHPRGGARRGDVRAEDQRGAGAPSRRLPVAHVPDWRGRPRPVAAVSGGAGAHPGGRAGGGRRLSPGKPAERRALPATPERIPRHPSAVPQGFLRSPPGCPSISLGDYSVCFVFLSSPPCVPFSRMAEAELHKERLQAIAVSPLSFYFLAPLSGVEGDPECFGATDIPAQ